MVTTVERVLGGRGSHGSGTLLLVVAGVHGNEPAGVDAARAVLAALDARSPALSGRVVFLAGNRAALAAGVRYVETDLNRMWSKDAVAELRGCAPERDRHERREQRELLDAIDRELAQSRGRVVLLDLHTTSAGGAPFAIIGDTLQSRAVALALQIPVILGLEENIDGTLLEHLGRAGHVAVGVEGGQHEAPETRANHEAAIWTTLVSTGIVAPRDVPDHAAHVARLGQAGHGLPRVVEILHRHDVAPDEVFRMHPGYANFQPVERGELLAHSDPGAREVCAPERGLILMPLYQAQGRDGFFLGRTVRPFWLALSAWMRRARVDEVLERLPGVRRRPGEPGVLEADARVARFLAPGALRLLGYRRVERSGERVVYVRRVEPTVV